MAKTANINVRIEPETKRSAEALFSSLGMTVGDAISIFLHKSLLDGGLPFSVKQPRYNAETEAAMQEARMLASGKISGKAYSSANELFDELKAEMEVEE